MIKIVAVAPENPANEEISRNYYPAPKPALCWDVLKNLLKIGVTIISQTNCARKLMMVRFFCIGSNRFGFQAVFDVFCYFVCHAMTMVAGVLLFKAGQGDALVIFNPFAVSLAAAKLASTQETLLALNPDLLQADLDRFTRSPSPTPTPPAFSPSNACSTSPPSAASKSSSSPAPQVITQPSAQGKFEA